MDYSAVTAQARQMRNMNIAQVIAENGGSYKDSTAGILDPIENAIARANSMAQANSARSANEARIQREWQEAQNAKAMEFNAAEAEKSRNWQEYMSNTAHQREIADLKAAGLNPVLSAMGGNGAAVTSGAQAQGVTSAGAKGEVDTSANQAIVNLLGSMLGYMGNLASSSISAQAAKANAERAAAATELVGMLSYEANKYSADQHYAASKYGSDMSAWIKEHFPDNVWNAGGTVAKIIGEFFGLPENYSVADVKEALAGLFSSGGSKFDFKDKMLLDNLYSWLTKNTRDNYNNGVYNHK